MANPLPDRPFRERRASLLDAFHRTQEQIKTTHPPHHEDSLTIYFLARDSLTRHGGTAHHRGTVVHIPEAFSQTLAISSNNPRLIEMLDIKTGRTRDVRPITAIKTILKHANITPHNETSPEIIATTFGEVLPTRFGYDCVLVEGDEIPALYRATPYTCMTGSASLDFYARNAPHIRAIKILKDEAIFGRAIVWELLNGNHYVDRIYPQGGAHMRIVQGFIEQHNWLVRANHGPDRPHHPESRHLITVPLHAPDETFVSAHSMGGFPYLDTFVYMKHNPDKSMVMLRAEPANGWVGAGFLRNAYANRFYCPLLQGWERNENALINIKVLAADGTFRTETAFSSAFINRHHQLIRHPEHHRVYAPHTMQDDFVTIIGGALALKQHTVTLRDGRAAFIRDAAHMHDDTYILLDGNLRNLAMLPNGRFVFRDDATFDPETRSWTLNE